MIIPQSVLKIADNSGGRRARCFKVLGGSKKRCAGIGDIIRVSILDASPTGRVKKGDVCFAVVVRTAFALKRADGTAIRFEENAAVLLNSKKELIGTRVFGPVTRELRADFMKVISLAQEVL